MLANKLLQNGRSGFITMGNHAVARAMLESGTRVITSYPGSPTPEIGTALVEYAKLQGDPSFHFENSVNEKVALEIAAGASLNGHLSCTFFKSVGLNVASDSLIQQALMNHIGGLVIVLGDDPGANSSQNEQDNRHFCRMSYIPMLEAGTPQEAYELYLESAKISQRLQMPVFLRLTTNVCHAKQHVSFRSLKPLSSDWKSRYHRDNGPYFPVTSNLFPLKKQALSKLESVGADCSRFVVQHGRGKGERGIISCGLPAHEAMEVCESASEELSLLQLKMTYPLPKESIVSFLSSHNEVYIVEELDRVLENEIKALAYDAGLTTRIHSRPQGELTGELDRKRIRRLLGLSWPELFPQATIPKRDDLLTLPKRPPQLCPGCGHRSAFFAAQAVLNDDSIVVGDIGCLTLGALPPHNMGDILFSMGHSVATAAGLALNNPERNVLALMGDGTFFHAGLPGVINAAANDSNITLYLLDNGTTAMTGHQPRPGDGKMGEKINIPALLQELGVAFVRQADAYNQRALQEMLAESFEYKGFAVVIAKHPCMLQLTRANRKKDPLFKLPPVQIADNLCDLQQTCITDFGCPSFERTKQGRIVVNEDLCIGCGSCIPTCPSGAIRRGVADNKRNGE